MRGGSLNKKAINYSLLIIINFISPTRRDEGSKDIQYISLGHEFPSSVANGLIRLKDFTTELPQLKFGPGKKNLQQIPLNFV